MPAGARCSMVSQADNVLLFAEFYAAALLHYHSSLHNICRVQFPDPSSLFRNSVMVPNYGHDEDGRGCGFYAAAGKKRAREDTGGGESGEQRGERTVEAGGEGERVWLEVTPPSSDFVVLDRQWPPSMSPSMPPTKPRAFLPPPRLPSSS